MIKKPTVSVVIAAYNVEPYIKTAIQSALSQTHPPIEILVIDDASTDQTRTVCQALQNPNVCLIPQSINRGPSACRNIGIHQAQGQWVAFLDADDWWEPDRLSTLVSLGLETRADIVGDNLWLIGDGQSKPWSHLFRENHYSIRRPRLVGFPDFEIFNFGQLHPMFKTSFITSHRITFDDSLRYLENLTFILECLENGGKMAVTPLPLYYYRSRPDSLVSHRDTAWPALITSISQARQRLHSPQALHVLELTRRQLAANIQFLMWRNWVYRRQWLQLAKHTLIRPRDAWNFLRRLPQSGLRRIRKRMAGLWA